MNGELAELFCADMDERTVHPAYGTAEYRALRERDAVRRRRLKEIVESGGLKEAEDYYRAAWILNHGESLEETPMIVMPSGTSAPAPRPCIARKTTSSVIEPDTPDKTDPSKKIAMPI